MLRDRCDIQDFVLLCPAPIGYYINISSILLTYQSSVFFVSATLASKLKFGV